MKEISEEGIYGDTSSRRSICTIAKILIRKLKLPDNSLRTGIDHGCFTDTIDFTGASMDVSADDQFRLFNKDGFSNCLTT